MGETGTDHPISVRLPGYVVEKIDELVKEKEFRSRSDFIKFAVTMALGQIMMEKARERAKRLTEEEFKEEAEEAWEKLKRGEFEEEGDEVLKALKEIDQESKRLTGARE
ncbi:ribbon-helix-helix domain-containing protein [Palaeococcus ferrophilus]|uniref:ribbon-helix-helix domain-containing protein n=1 Tax=Palaeococcus ferrophilus TaxID=83868 RepID=UPI00064F8851|nr:type II toxin-antitoxin system ParD family antitoxin [Palaeococcus ferrophilus]